MRTVEFGGAEELSKRKCDFSFLASFSFYIYIYIYNDEINASESKKRTHHAHVTRVKLRYVLWRRWHLKGLAIESPLSCSSMYGNSYHYKEHTAHVETKLVEEEGEKDTYKKKTIIILNIKRQDFWTEHDCTQ